MLLIVSVREFMSLFRYPIGFPFGTLPVLQALLVPVTLAVLGVGTTWMPLCFSARSRWYKRLSFVLACFLFTASCCCGRRCEVTCRVLTDAAPRLEHRWLERKACVGYRCVGYRCGTNSRVLTDAATRLEHRWLEQKACVGYRCVNTDSGIDLDGGRTNGSRRRWSMEPNDDRRCGWIG